MPSSEWIRSNIKVVAIAIAMAGALNFAAVRMLQAAGPQNQATAPSAPTTAPAKLSPVPVPGALAQPRSLKQLGVPTLQTLAEMPADNPQSPEKIALGEKLFFDPGLSVDGTVACASCHNPDRAFTDGRPTSVGVHGRVGQRNAPTVLNALYGEAQFWDGRAKTLEDQAAFPISNPSEMGQPSLNVAITKIAVIPEHRQEFQAVFGEAPSGLNLVRAIASYERTLVSFDSPFDRYIAGDRSALDTSANRAGHQSRRCHDL